jgi:hypothetical protein
VIRAVLLIFAASLLLDAQVKAEPIEQHLVGTYVVIGARAASDVAAPLDLTQSDPSKTLIGTPLVAGDSVSWDGERCAVRPDAHPSNAALIDPNLADLQLAPASTDSRLNANLILDCLGRAPSDIWSVLVVDRRVLVARTMPFTTYLILEQPLAPGDVTLLKRKLAQAGFDPGSRDERMDDMTRAALAEFARKSGAPAKLLPGVVTENLLNALAEMR